MTNGNPAPAKKKAARAGAKTPATASGAAPKRPAAKKTAAPAAAVTPERAAAVVTEPERHALVAQAAYFRAKARGFEAGRELDDWVEAESEVDAKLGKG
jgi:hypothetical protein